MLFPRLPEPSPQIKMAFNQNSKTHKKVFNSKSKYIRQAFGVGHYNVHEYRHTYTFYKYLSKFLFHLRKASSLTLERAFKHIVTTQRASQPCVRVHKTAPHSLNHRKKKWHIKDMSSEKHFGFALLLCYGLTNN